MNSAKAITFDEVVEVILPDLFGKPCCRQRVGLARSLIVGFGERIARRSKARLNDDFNGEWEIGDRKSVV